MPNPRSVSVSTDTLPWSELCDTLTIGLVVLSPQRGWLYANPAALRLLALDEADLLTATPAEIGLVDGAPRIAKRVVRRGERTLQLEVQQGQGDPPLEIIAIQDATAALELSNDQAAFLNDLFFQLRSGLTGVRGVLDALLATCGADDDDGELLAMALRRIDGLSRMINDARDAYLLRTGLMRPRLRFERLSLVEAARWTFDALAGDAAPDVAFSAPPCAIDVHADPSAIHRVLYHMLSNAMVRAGALGRVELALTASDGDAVVSVRDNGPDIPPEQLFRINNSLCGELAETNDALSGLGLYVARGLMELMNGSLLLHNETGRGALLEARLPLPA